jgi:hypothetical protein
MDQQTTKHRYIFDREVSDPLMFGYGFMESETVSQVC